jgi:hypothetical protein
MRAERIWVTGSNRFPYALPSWPSGSSKLHEHREGHSDQQSQQEKKKRITNEVFGCKGEGKVLNFVNLRFSGVIGAGRGCIEHEARQSGASRAALPSESHART